MGYYIGQYEVGERVEWRSSSMSDWQSGIIGRVDEDDRSLMYRVDHTDGDGDWNWPVEANVRKAPGAQRGFEWRVRVTYTSEWSEWRRVESGTNHMHPAAELEFRSAPVRSAAEIVTKLRDVIAGREDEIPAVAAVLRGEF